MVSEARSAIARYSTSWVGVVDDGHLLGWIGESQLDGHTSLDELELRPFVHTVSPTDSLRAALDLVVRSHERVAVVCADDRYLGILDLDAIAGEVTE
jgi:CBS domain-containing protein